MNTLKLIYGIAALTFLDIALAANDATPTQTGQVLKAAPSLSQIASTTHNRQLLADGQMDKVTAGSVSLEIGPVRVLYPDNTAIGVVQRSCQRANGGMVCF